MKKLIALFVFGFFFIPTLTATAGTVTIATGEWPPFSGKNLDGYGLHSKIIDKVFKEMGHEVQFKFMPWKRVYELTKKGDYIATFTWSKIPERQKEVLYPENELAVSKEVGFYKKSKFPNGLDIKNLDDIKAKNLRVVGITSYWYEKPLKEKGIKANLVSTADLAWKMLNGDRADILIENSDVGKAESLVILGADSDGKFATSSPLKTQQMYLIFSKHHPDSAEMIKSYDAAVTQLKASGSL
ncbi:MAG: transporter substrate-binding domain-containing protein [Desulfobacterales bacterium]|nr:transporter substrate-binding domain-containing protein [Desulfobacterales bacterium]